MKRITILFFLVFFFFGSVLFANDYNTFYDADGIISQHCEDKWPDDYRMQRYCIDRQTKAVEELEKGCPDDIPYDIFIKVRNKCGAKWLNNYRMREYCEKKQFEAWLSLNK